MLERKIKVGGIYKHFKGTFHRVICIAKDSESLEDMVVYTHEGENEFWVRPKDMFLSEIDSNKYPNVKQKYRFELIKTPKKENIE